MVSVRSSDRATCGPSPRRRRGAAGLDFATAANDLSQLGMELHVFHVQDAARHTWADSSTGCGSEREIQFASGLTNPAYTGLAYSALLAALAIVALSDATNLTSLGAAMLVMLRSLSYGQALQART